MSKPLEWWENVQISMMDAYIRQDGTPKHLAEWEEMMAKFQQDPEEFRKFRAKLNG